MPFWNMIQQSIEIQSVSSTIHSRANLTIPFWYKDRFFNLVPFWHGEQNLNFLQYFFILIFNELEPIVTFF